MTPYQRQAALEKLGAHYLNLIRAETRSAVDASMATVARDLGLVRHVQLWKEVTTVTRVPDGLKLEVV